LGLNPQQQVSSPPERIFNFPAAYRPATGADASGSGIARERGMPSQAPQDPAVRIKGLNIYFSKLDAQLQLVTASVLLGLTKS
jgi:hypothetical protein